MIFGITIDKTNPEYTVSDFLTYMPQFKNFVNAASTAIDVLYGNEIWSDSANVYYSYGSLQYILADNAFDDATWKGLIQANGKDIWSADSNIYWSDMHNQYALQKGKWTAMSWTGLNNFIGEDVWTDGKNYYYSNGYDQYILSNAAAAGSARSDFTAIETTSAGTIWTAIAWTGLQAFNGRNIWTNGTDIYYSFGSQQYKLSGNGWIKMTWSGLSLLIGMHVWTDGTKYYYSNGSQQFVLNGTTWSAKVWSGLTNFKGNDVWNDGGIYHCSNGVQQYKLSGNAWSAETWSNAETLFDKLYQKANNKIFYSIFGTDWDYAMSLCIAHYMILIAMQAQNPLGSDLSSLASGNNYQGILSSMSVGSFTKSFDLAKTMIDSDDAKWWNMTSFGAALMALYKTKGVPSIFVVTPTTVSLDKRSEYDAKKAEDLAVIYAEMQDRKS